MPHPKRLFDILNILYIYIPTLQLMKSIIMKTLQNWNAKVHADIYQLCTVFQSSIIGTLYILEDRNVGYHILLR